MDGIKHIETNHYYVLYKVQVHKSIPPYSRTIHRKIFIDEKQAKQCFDVMQKYYNHSITCHEIVVQMKYEKVLCVFDGEHFNGLNGDKYDYSHIKYIKDYLGTHDIKEDPSNIIHLFGEKQRHLRSSFVRTVACIFFPVACCFGYSDYIVDE